MPLALVGSIICLVLYEVFRIGECKFRLERFPILRQILLHAIQFGNLPFFHLFASDCCVPVHRILFRM